MSLKFEAAHFCQMFVGIRAHTLLADQLEVFERQRVEVRDGLYPVARQTEVTESVQGTEARYLSDVIT